MSAEDSEQKGPLNSAQLRSKYEGLLWQRADDLSQLSAPLTEHQNQLYQEVQTMRSRHLNLHERDVLAKKEDDYWRIQGKMQDLAKQEDEIVEALRGLENGTVDENRLRKIAPPPPEETTQLSKRKQKILEERMRLGDDPREISWDIYREFGSREFGSNPTRLTTGRHQKRISGSFHPVTAEDVFYFRTADTHGGKVGHGKKGGSYATPAGRRHRKK